MFNSHVQKDVEDFSKYEQVDFEKIKIYQLNEKN